ncbi:hypothetical protein BDV32DRAFT_134009 [Aspergillus pseudonomiae]|nr:hypothetical protein BDV32DRAFT_134009 [Aspergillus pseudonomiae]
MKLSFSLCFLYFAVSNKLCYLTHQSCFHSVCSFFEDCLEYSYWNTDHPSQGWRQCHLTWLMKPTACPRSGTVPP